VFYRHHRHTDPAAPMLLLLHGWTADADTETIAADHLCTITDPAAYSAATRRLVDRVVGDLGGAGLAAVAAG
jgi:hypothetical protein